MTHSCDDEKKAGIVHSLLRVRDELALVEGIIDECAKSYGLLHDDEYLLMALAALEDLAEWLPTAVSRLEENLEEEVGGDLAERARYYLLQLRERRRRLGCA